MRSLQAFTVTENRRIAAGTWLLNLAGDSAGISRPGQFVNVEIPGFYLRRPFSVYDWSAEGLQLIYKELGQGSRSLTEIQTGSVLSVLSGLGNGFVPADGARPLVVGGGVGVVPLFALTRELIGLGQSPRVVLGFGGADEVYLAEEMAELGAQVSVATVDGSVGVKGFVTDALPSSGDFDYLYACGPTAMLAALADETDSPAQFSLEERMACGFGACVGCVVSTTSGMSRVCKDGPVFTRKELQW